MTKKERKAFRQGVEEGFVKAAELSSEPEKILQQFRPVSPNQRNWLRSTAGRKMNAGRSR